MVKVTKHINDSQGTAKQRRTRRPEFQKERLNSSLKKGTNLNSSIDTDEEMVLSKNLEGGLSDFENETGSVCIITQDSDDVTIKNGDSVVGTVPFKELYFAAGRSKEEVIEKLKKAGSLDSSLNSSSDVAKILAQDFNLEDENNWETVWSSFEKAMKEAGTALNVSPREIDEASRFDMYFNIFCDKVAAGATPLAAATDIFKDNLDSSCHDKGKLNAAAGKYPVMSNGLFRALVKNGHYEYFDFTSGTYEDYPEAQSQAMLSEMSNQIGSEVYESYQINLDDSNPKLIDDMNSGAFGRYQDELDRFLQTAPRAEDGGIHVSDLIVTDVNTGMNSSLNSSANVEKILAQDFNLENDANYDIVWDSYEEAMKNAGASLNVDTNEINESTRLDMNFNIFCDKVAAGATPFEAATAIFNENLDSSKGSMNCSAGKYPVMSNGLFRALEANGHYEYFDYTSGTYEDYPEAQSQAMLSEMSNQIGSKVVESWQINLDDSNPKFVDDMNSGVFGQYQKELDRFLQTAPRTQDGDISVPDLIVTGMGGSMNSSKRSMNCSADTEQKITTESGNEISMSDIKIVQNPETNELALYIPENDEDMIPDGYVIIGNVVPGSAEVDEVESEEHSDDDQADENGEGAKELDSSKKSVNSSRLNRAARRRAKKAARSKKKN